MRVFSAGGSLNSSRTIGGGRAIAQARPAPRLRRRLGPNGALPTREDGPEYLKTHVVEKRDVAPPFRHVRLNERQMIPVQLVGFAQALSHIRPGHYHWLPVVFRVS